MQSHNDELNRRDLDQVEKDSVADSCCDAGRCDGGEFGRRTFIKLAGVGAAALTSSARSAAAIAGPFTREDLIDHCVPADKKLSPDWIRSLTERGTPDLYQGQDLETIGMPIGGIGAGQLYITGDGRLAHWDVFNWKTAGYGYPRGPAEPRSPVAQGFAIEIEQNDRIQTRALDIQGFPQVKFRGEYPAARVDYRDDKFPATIALTAFSPFIPLNADDSSLPATILQFTVKNTSPQPMRMMLAGWLQNAVCLHSGGAYDGELVNQLQQSESATMIVGSARPVKRQVKERPVIVLESFEGDNYADWKVEGAAFGTAPARGTLTGQQKVSGYQGQGLVNTFLGGDKPQGKLVSPEFTINRRYIRFLVGGGNHAEKTCINLVVGDQVVKSTTGKSNERLNWHNWNVADLEGKQARIEIVDEASGPWGHINIDQMELADRARTTNDGPLETQLDYGTMGIGVLAPPRDAVTSLSVPNDALPASLFKDAGLASAGDGTAALGSRLCGAVGSTARLGPGESTTIQFIIGWHFVKRPESGHYYGSRFKDATDVIRYVARHADRLTRQTLLWVDTYYDSTLPYWLLDRIHSTVSTLATSTCEIWKNGRFWAYEGVRCCQGTCGHVWNYEHALARLFPQLELSVREMQDFNPQAGLVEETGMIRFRGNWPDFWCGDAQTGYILKAYREHQASATGAFLKKNWPQIRKALEFLFVQDQNDDGIIEGQQHNTYDINFFGPNPMIGTLYLGALRAGEEMAAELGDTALAERCRKTFESGRRYCTEKLFDGEYYLQIVDLKKHPKHQHGHGCLSDQLFGQGWAHQVGLGYILPPENVAKTLQSIWEYNWAPDIAAQNEEHPPQRWFAYPGEAGLFTCTWPKSKHLGPDSVLYRDEIWTGIEYQVAGHMAWEGMVTEALAICRGVHDRYHPSKHNPWNEIECGDHYARGMASWGVLIGLSGFEYHGPKQQIGFAPRISDSSFRCAFTAAECWGSLVQQRKANKQVNRFEIKWGVLPVRKLVCTVPEGRKVRNCQVRVGEHDYETTVGQTGSRVTVALAEPMRVEEGHSIEIELTL